jgi:hypothetical protein
LRRAAYDIKKFRAKGIVRKIEKSRRYELLPEGVRVLTALLVLRDKVIRPLLAASGQPDPPLQPPRIRHPSITSTKESETLCSWGKQFATVGGSQALLHLTDKPLVIVHEAFYGFARQYFGIAAARGGKTRESCLHIGAKVDFHSISA